MAVEARVNDRMSKVARCQAKAWGDEHRIDMEIAERIYAENFANEYWEDTGTYAIDISEDQSGTIDPNTKAKCAAWIKLNADAFTMANDIRNQGKAEYFSNEYGAETAETAFNILNGIANENEMGWIDYADHWRSFHMEEYEKKSVDMIDSFAKDWKDDNEVNASYEAAKIIENTAIAKHSVDAEVKKEYECNPTKLFQASCFATRNQGVVKKSLETPRDKAAKNAARFWQEVLVQTEEFKKGSYLLLSEAQRADPKQDRFYGFRNRLLNKYAWLYGYLCKRHEELAEEMRTVDDKDPTKKTQHRLRPSELRKIILSRENDFLQFKKSTDQALKDVISKISTWRNSYFGRQEE